MKLDPKDYIVITVIVIIALAAGLLSAYQYIDSIRKDSKDEETSNKLINAQQKALKASEDISIAQQKTLDISEKLKEAQYQNIVKANDLIEAQAKINQLQGEIIKQVTGDGYPRFNLMNSLGNNFEFSISGSSNYPIINVNTRVSNSQKLLSCEHKSFPEKVEMNKSCFDSTILYSSNQSVDLSGTLINFLHLSLQKQNYYLSIEFMCKNIRVVQYSIITLNGQNAEHSFRIYEVSKIDNSFGRLLEDSNPHIPESEYKKKFFFKKTLIVDFSK
jgi:hypothetical protein